MSINGLSQQHRPARTEINEARLRSHIKFLSNDALEGRGTGARGGEIAAKYIASQLEALGLKGAGDHGSFFQPVSLVGVKADPNTKLTISGRGGKESFKFADEFVAFTGAQTEDVDVDADLVFVGYGIDAPGYRWNDYKGDASDYRGKILVMLVNDPPATSDEPNLFGGKTLTYFGRWTYKYEEAARRGAAGVILLHTDQSAGYPWSVVRTSNGSWRFDIARTQNDATPFLQFRSWMTDEAAHTLMKRAGQGLDALRIQAASRNFQPVKLGLKGMINLKSEVKRVAAPNVVGILQGRDPKLRNEYVVYSAHWDHLGVGRAVLGDAIYNGAADNATGCALLLELARLWCAQSPRPKRSALFLAVTAEEKGLLGSKYYTQHPLVPLGKTALNLNFDMILPLGVPESVVVTGAERTTAWPAVKAAAAKNRLEIEADQRAHLGIFYRSDHFSMAQAGVPAFSVGTGMKIKGKPKDFASKAMKEFNDKAYHSPQDELRPEWDFAGFVVLARFTLDVAHDVANADRLPTWNPGDEFRPAREKSGVK